MSDVRIERMVGKGLTVCVAAQGPEHQTEPRDQVTYHTYLASGRRQSYTPSIEHVVD